LTFAFLLFTFAFPFALVTCCGKLYKEQARLVSFLIHQQPGEVASMKKAITLTVNGAAQHHTVEPRMLLVHYVRDVLGLTGTHVGCETSICGACTVLLDGQSV